MTVREEVLDIIAELEKHPADFLPTWIEIRGEIEKLRLMVAAFDGGDYTENDLDEHSSLISLSVKSHLETEQMMNNIVIARQSRLN